MSNEPYLVAPREPRFFGMFPVVDRWMQRVTELINQISDGIDVRIQDQATEVVDLHLTEQLSDFTLTTAAALDDSSVTGDGDGVYTPLVGDMLCLKEDRAFYQGEILTVTPNGGASYTLTVDTPLDYPFTLAGGCSIRNLNMAVDGSVTPRIFSVSPEGLDPTIQWDICRILFSFVGPGVGTIKAPDDTNFGSQGPITKGMVVRKTDGTYKNLWNAKTNADMKAHMYDVEYTIANKDGEFGVTARRSFNGFDKNGVVVRIENNEVFANADKLQVIIQDDLSDHTLVQAVAQGHVTDN